MIQVCSSCGTRWNVRDKQRVWCPRCQGTLLPPTDQHQPTAPPAGGHWNRPPAPSGAPRPAQTSSGPSPAPPGYRWIAVRPGGAPPPRHQRRPLGPTPRYEVIPRWGLGDHIGYQPPPPPEPERRGPSSRTVQRVLKATAIAFGVAALAYLVRYILLIINRTTLLNPPLAISAEWFGILAGAVAFVIAIVCWVVLTWWLVARRAAVFAHRGIPDPRPQWALWVGCLVPGLNLVWAPVFVVDTATLEDIYYRQRKPIIVWSAFWVLSAAVSLFALFTSFTQEPQGIADNHVTTIFACLMALATVLCLTRVYRGFESKPVTRPTHRWVMVAAGDGRSVAPAEAESRGDAPESAVAVERNGQEPAA